jgi:MurNAc alpha-1-phosphate uridylyltransferase
MPNKPSLMLFGAGFGTRMGDLAKTTPKPLISVAGKPLVDHAIEIAHEAKIENIAINTHYLAEQIQDHFLGTGIKVVHEVSTILETGGGLKNTLSILGTDPVITMNTDAVWRGNNPINELLSHWKPIEADALLLLCEPSRTHGHEGGDFTLDDQGTISRGGPFVYTGLQIIKTDALSQIKQTAFSISKLWDISVKSGTLKGHVYSGDWCDVGHPEGINIAERILAK